MRVLQKKNNGSDTIKRIELPKDTVQEMVRLSQQGVGHRKIRKKLGLQCSNTVVLRILNENCDTVSKNNAHRKYSHDRCFFKKIDTEEKAYWLGFLYADGNVHKTTVSVRQSARDIEHLKSFNRCPKNETPIKTETQNSWGQTTESAVATIYSREMCNDLIALGCVERKSDKLTFPSEDQVPQHLVRHFVRGYVDGDGSISKIQDGKFYQVGILGTENMVEGIKSFLGVGHLTTSQESRSDNVYYINFGGNLQVLEKLEILYGGATVYLPWKYRMYEELKHKYPQSLIHKRKNLSSRFR